VVVTSEVLDGPRSIVVDQAENRLWTAMAVLCDLLS
jgi:ornithine carbamoyltransferase